MKSTSSDEKPNGIKQIQSRNNAENRVQISPIFTETKISNHQKYNSEKCSIERSIKLPCHYFQYDNSNLEC